MAKKTTETPEEQTSAPQAIGITTTAAKIICEIIALCTKRGAFQPNELTTVGALYDQLLAQIPAEELQAPATAEEAPAEEEVQLELELEADAK